MKIIVSILIYFYVTLPLESRLIPKNSESTTEAKSVDLSSSRVTRSVDDDDSGRGYSKEYDNMSNEYSTGEKKRSDMLTTKATRFLRESQESQSETPVSNSTPNSNTQTTKKGPVMVKKPIPKFNEMDYDDDFQTKVIRSHIKLTDSGEHEDEDFNVDDYDFDVNHDEFAGRGKPLEPRVKDKRILEQNIDPETESTLTVTQGSSVVKNQNKLVAIKVLSKRNDEKARTNKRATPKGTRTHLKKGSDNKDEDYDEDLSSSSTVGYGADKLSDSDEMSEERDDSKEMKHRAIRSPLHRGLYVDGWGKSGAPMVKNLKLADYSNESPFLSEALVFKWF